jgi:hypothetical protein
MLTQTGTSAKRPPVPNSTANDDQALANADVSAGSLTERLLQKTSDRTISDGEGPALPAHLKEISQRSAQTRLDNLFPKVEAIRSNVMESLKKHTYTVEELYAKTGVCQEIARSEMFKDFIVAVILANTIWIAVETDINHASVLCQATPLVQIVDNVFCITFSFEVIVRFFSFKNKLDAFRDYWFIFDGSLALLMVWETWVIVLLYLTFGFASGADAARDTQVMRVLRLVRLVRVARATRLVQYSPELMIIARGLLVAIRSVAAVICMMLLVVYVFSVMFKNTLSGPKVGVCGF